MLSITIVTPVTTIDIFVTTTILLWINISNHYTSIKYDLFPLEEETTKDQRC